MEQYYRGVKEAPAISSKVMNQNMMDLSMVGQLLLFVSYIVSAGSILLFTTLDRNAASTIEHELCHKVSGRSIVIIGKLSEKNRLHY